MNREIDILVARICFRGVSRYSKLDWRMAKKTERAGKKELDCQGTPAAMIMILLSLNQTRNFRPALCNSIMKDRTSG